MSGEVRDQASAVIVDCRSKRELSAGNYFEASHMKFCGILLTSALMLSAVATVAQTLPPPPAPEIKKLDVFAGSWIVEGTLKPGPNEPGGTMTEDETCTWMDGGFYLVCHSDYKSSMGNGVGLSVMGYSTDEKAYTYREFNSFGEFDDSRGNVDGDTWTWNNDEKMGGATVKGRFTIKMTSAKSYTFTFDMSPDGTKWSTVMDGKASKK